MRWLLVLLLLTACSEPTVAPPTDTREPVGVQYVTSPELKVYEKPDEASAVVATYQYNETVPVLVRQGEWVEIRTGDTSGWVKASDIGDASQAQQTGGGGDPTPRFQLAPSPVPNLTAKGDIYIEADVNTDGDVVNTRVISNDTGMTGLAEANANALRKAKFYPIIKNGQKLPFKYYHRVSY